MELLHNTEVDRAIEEPAQRIDSQDEELWGYGVTLAQLTAVPDRGSGGSVQENLGAGDDRSRAIQSRKRLPKPWHRSTSNKNGHETESKARAKSRFRSTRGAPSWCKQTRGLAHQDEIVVKALPGDERVLDVPDQVVELGR